MAWREQDQLEPLCDPPPQLAVGMSDECGAMPDCAQAVDGQQDLILSASPGSRRIDVEREHSSHSFANFRKT